MRIAVASDHAGNHLRTEVLRWLKEHQYDVVDHGPSDTASVDYPLYAETVARAIAAGEATFGILICGSGIGMSMAANRIPKVRAALCTCAFTARASRAHNDANVLCMGERVVGVGVALDMLDVFLHTPFEGGRHIRRVEQMTRLEK